MSTLKKRRKQQSSQENTKQMSVKTMSFIQKICYKQSATVDMTKNGFISDSKMLPINLLLKPLRAQLEKIIGDKVQPNPILKHSSSKRNKEKCAVKFNINGNSPLSSYHSTVSCKKQAAISTLLKLKAK